jgi:hypothetical protein
MISHVIRYNIDNTMVPDPLPCVCVLACMCRRETGPPPIRIAHAHTHARTHTHREGGVRREEVLALDVAELARLYQVHLRPISYNIMLIVLDYICGTRPHRPRICIRFTCRTHECTHTHTHTHTRAPLHQVHAPPILGNGVPYRHQMIIIQSRILMTPGTFLCNET